MTSVAPLRDGVRRPELFRELVECSQDAILIKTVDGQITFWNAAAERLYGYQPGEAVGRHIGLIIPPHLQAEEDGLLKRISSGEMVEHYETQRLTRSGRLVDVDVSLWPLRGADGTVHTACSVMRDITVRKRAEARTDELAVLVESSQDATLIKTLDGTITFWNAAAERLFGHPAAQAVGHHIGLIIPPELRAEEAGLLARIAAGERIEHYETRRLIRDGCRVDIDVTLWPIRDRSGTITAACSTMRDLTSRKRAEKELAELRHLSLALRLMGEAEQIDGTDAAARYLPSTQGRGVGGDWYDLIDLGAGRTGIIIGDVMGRGLEAAVVMGQLRSAARALALHGAGPAELMQSLDTFTRGLPEQFVTCLYLEADPSRGEVTVCSAGHLPMLLGTPDGTVQRPAVPTGIPLGVGKAPYEQVRLPLRAGTTLTLYTDGLVETPHSDIDARLDSLTAAVREASAAAGGLEEAADHILESMLPGATAAGADDVTLLLVTFPTAPVDTMATELPGEPASVADGRRLIAARLRSGGLEELADTAQLLASELLSNAVLHTQGPIGLRMWRSARELGIEVTDRSHSRPRTHVPDSDTEHGRGLLLVDALADAWGTRPHETGKTVWCTLPLPTRPGMRTDQDKR
ncbi:SpoIIE family protein phosphatase [Streptomyces rimosus]|uniref:SpoIIE family protein phosphatase n=1 Tax=Streptomyces rimosus TaxID=1927 RepID=UPI0037D0EF99